MVKKPRNIGFDLDDVLLDFFDPLRKYLNEKLNKEIKKEDLKSFSFEQYYGIPGDEFIKMIVDFYSHEGHLNALPVKGSVEAIQRIKENNNLYIVTARPDIVEERTMEWLNKHFPNQFQKVYFGNYLYNVEKKRKKCDICKELGIEIFIDDSIDNAKEISEVGIPVLLPDAPWNQSQNLPDLVTRVHSWREIEEKLSKY